MSRTINIVYTCDICGRISLGDITDTYAYPPGWRQITGPMRPDYIMCPVCVKDTENRIKIVKLKVKETGNGTI